VYKRRGPKITVSEFEKRILAGDVLVILDDLVLDMSEYMFSHPGGTHLIEQNIGRDISKFFYGGYSLDGNLKMQKANTEQHEKHAHTNVARKQMVKYIVGIMERENSNFNGQIDKT
jgi:cytochrome b involved in lipid metabolism